MQSNFQEHQKIAEEKRWEVLRRLSFEQKFAIIINIYSTAREWKEAGLRTLHPDLPEAEIQRLLRDSFLYAKY